MKHNNISIFVTHVGCPHMCAFCNQHTITGNSEIPHAEDVKRICSKALEQITDPQETEIAFFGGSFTAVPREYMLELLQAASEFVGEGKFKGIRISTRPDYIDKSVLDILKEYGVTSIELGAQSLCDEVLDANERGHSEKDVIDASTLIKSYGFELGLQMMVGLYKSSEDRELYTVKRIIDIEPKTVRIYPVVVLEGTKLAELFKKGDYKLMPFETVSALCAKMLKMFYGAGIDVIKLGLHSSELVEKSIVAGYYHPAFSEIVQSRLFLEAIKSEITDNKENIIEIAVNRRSYSVAAGHKKSNINALKELGIDCRMITDDSLSRQEIKINGEIINVFKIT